MEIDLQWLTLIKGLFSRDIIYSPPIMYMFFMPMKLSMEGSAFEALESVMTELDQNVATSFM